MKLDVVIKVKDASVHYRKRQKLFRHTKYLALNEVTFNVKRGETLGIIGRNGSGKSTLLKLLGGIYKPDNGHVTVNNANVALLSLAAGFDPQLSGADNILISGMMLGLKKFEVKRIFNSIVEYSELGSFILEPVKTYSSGMRARLSFSIAIQMHTDVLLIDEVLGVGDSSFRSKAEETMRAKLGSDQTVVLVSHSAAQIKRVCERAIWLEKGQIKLKGPVDRVVRAYENAIKQQRVAASSRGVEINSVF